MESKGSRCLVTVQVSIEYRCFYSLRWSTAVFIFKIQTNEYMMPNINITTMLMSFPLLFSAYELEETDVAGLVLRLDLMILKVFSNLNNSMVTLYGIAVHNIWIILDPFEKGHLCIFGTWFYRVIFWSQTCTSVGFCEQLRNFNLLWLEMSVLKCTKIPPQNCWLFFKHLEILFLLLEGPLWFNSICKKA